MATVSRTYTFSDGTTAYGSEVQTEFATIYNAWNNHDSGSSTWTQVKGATITATTQLLGKGTATNDSASSGYIGEYVESSITSFTNFPTTTQWGDLTSISLTAGDWRVWVCVSANLNGATVTRTQVGISTTSGNNAPSIATNRMDLGEYAADGNTGGTFGPIRLSLSGSSTAYLKYYASYSAATPQAVGFIHAIRVR